jgi:hypothetical protein
LRPFGAVQLTFSNVRTHASAPEERSRVCDILACRFL